MTMTPQSQWQSIRPWTPRLSLAIREITSVSVTFILASTFTNSNGEPDPSLASLGLDDHEHEDGDDNDVDVESPESREQAVVSDTLAKGFSINVNGVPWQRVLIRIDDKADEAVIIIYGLMPGRQYDIDLGLVRGGQNSNLRRHVTTEDSSGANGTSPHQENEPDLPVASEPVSPAPLPSASPNHHAASTTAPTPLTVEDRLNQLQANLSLVNSDRDSLAMSLKSSRRDVQKADAALRSEIDVLKRASEKHVAAEHRARQKVLALQEAVKRAQSATRDVEGLVREVEAALPGLRKKRDEKEAEYARVKEETERAQRERDKETEKDKKRIEAVTGELTGLGNKLEKLHLKKDKLESGVISDLEERLQEIQREIQKVEADPFALPDIEEPAGHDSDASAFGHSDGPSPDQIPRPGTLYLSPFHLPVQRQRHQTQHSLGAIARPSFPPIQRPSNLAQQQQQWTPNRTPNNNPTLLHSHPHTPVVHNRQVPTKSSAPSRLMQYPYTGTPSAGSPAQTSALSSRAPAFEPTPGLRATHPASGVETSSYSIPIHRPRQSISSPSRVVRGNPNLLSLAGTRESRGS